MLEKLTRIFQMKATLDAPSESFEQEKIFVEIESWNTRVKGDFQTFRASGVFYVFAQNEKMQAGYFSNMIEAANADDCRPFHFSNIDSVGQFRENNLSERRVSFEYFDRISYDPNKGELNELELNEE